MDWATVKPLLRNRKLGAAAKLAYLQLWHHAAEVPGELTITAKALAKSLGREAKAGRQWIGELADFGLVEIREWVKQAGPTRGTVRLWIYRPAPGDVWPAPPDPQRSFLDDPSPAAESAAALSTPENDRSKLPPDDQRKNQQTPGAAHQAENAAALSTAESAAHHNHRRYVSTNHPQSAHTYHNHEAFAGAVQQAAGDALSRADHIAAAEASKTALVEEVAKIVADPRLHRSVIMKAATAVVDFHLTKGRLLQLAYKSVEKDTPGAWFQVCAKNECQKLGIPWT
jgi:hypothetical protein